MALHRFCYLLIISLCICSASAQTLNKDTVDKLKGATVFIHIKTRDYLSGEEKASSGSGFFINRYGYVATNWHVVRPFSIDYFLLTPSEPRKIKVFINSGKPNEEVVDATIVAADEEQDIAILATGKTNSPFLKLGVPSDLYETRVVWALGFPLGKKFRFFE